MILIVFLMCCVLQPLLHNYCVFGKRESLHRFVVDEDAKPPIFGSYSYDPVKQAFVPPPPDKSNDGGADREPYREPDREPYREPDREPYREPDRGPEHGSKEQRDHTSTTAGAHEHTISTAGHADEIVTVLRASDFLPNIKNTNKTKPPNRIEEITF